MERIVNSNKLDAVLNAYREPDIVCERRLHLFFNARPTGSVIAVVPDVNVIFVITRAGKNVILRCESFSDFKILLSNFLGSLHRVSAFFQDSFTSLPVMCSGVKARHCTLDSALSSSRSI